MVKELVKDTINKSHPVESYLGCARQIAVYYAIHGVAGHSKVKGNVVEVRRRYLRS